MSTEEVENIAKEQGEVYTHVAFKMVQTAGVLAPPLVLGRQLYRRKFTVSSWLRRSAVWTFAVAPAAGFGMAWLRLRNEPDIAIYDRAYRLRHNPHQVRVDDFSKVGALLGALITTTIFLRRTSWINNIFGGAAIGIGGGVITHTVKMMQEEGAKKAAKEAAEALPDPAALAEGAVKGKK